MDNYLALEGHIITRLTDRVPGLKKVYGMADFAAVQDRMAQFAPCACVLYAGDSIPGSGAAGQGEAQALRQRWVVWLVVRNVHDAAAGTAARTEAGELLAQIIQALAGWSPAAPYRPLRRGSAPGPVFEAGVIYFPVQFEAPLITMRNEL